MDNWPEPRLLLEWEGEEARWRHLSAFLLAVFAQIIVALLLLLSPQWLRFLGVPVTAVAAVTPKQQTTFLLYPQSLPEKLRQPPITNKLSDQNRIAQGRAPKVNPNGIHAPYMRGNSKLQDLQGGRQKPAPQPSPPPSPPPQQAANQQPQKQAPAPPKPQPPQEAKLRLQDVPTRMNSSTPRIQVPSSTAGQAIQQSLEAAVQNRNDGPAVGPGDSSEMFQNLNPNFSTSGPIILSDTRGVNFGPYLARVVYIVRRNWYSVIPESARLGEKGRVALVFDIVKDGSVPELRLVTSSGSNALDLAALASIKASNPFPPLPQEFTGKDLRLEFIYLYNVGTQGY